MYSNVQRKVGDTINAEAIFYVQTNVMGNVLCSTPRYSVNVYTTFYTQSNVQKKVLATF